MIGDLAGHSGELRAELTRLGADPRTGRLPEDLIVIQVGDLVHRGPDSDGVVALVDRYLSEQPGQWVQLIGNHEAQYVREPAFDWPDRIGDDAAATIRSWWEGGRLLVGVAVRGAGEDFLVTHAGLTEGFWRQALDAPIAAEPAAGALNSFIGTHDDVLFHAGQVLGGGPPNLTAGPVWAGAASELVPSWLRAGRPMPFSQIHGHSTVVDWKRRRVDATAEVAALVELDEAAAHEFVAVPGGARIIGVDPRHGRRPHRPWRAFVLAEGSVL